MKELSVYSNTKYNNTHISYSEFSLYNECAHKHLIFKFLNLENQDSSIHLIFGNAIHSSIEKWVKENLDLQERIQYFSYTFRKDMLENLIPKEQMDETENFIIQGVEILKKLDLEIVLGGYEIINVEEPLYEEVYKKFKFKGFIDLVAYNKKTGRYLILDWKTSGEKWDIDKKKKDEIFLCQMRFYKFFWAKKNNVPLSLIDCKYVVLNRLNNKKKPTGGFGELQVVDINSSEEEIFFSLKKLAETIRKIHIENIFPKIKIIGNEKKSCMFCKFKGGIHPLCNSKYNQYVELLNNRKKIC